MRNARGSRSRRVAAAWTIALLSSTASGFDLLAQPTGSASGGGPFDSLSVALRLTANIDRNEAFDRFWEAKPGIDAEVSTPFYIGTAEAGLHLARFSARSDSQPDFSAWLPYLGWGIGWSPDRRLTWHNSFRVGSWVMHFGDDAGAELERELVVDLSSRVTLPVTGRWSLDVGARYQAVFTHERLRFILLMAGARRTFATPGWLREFLR